MSKKTMAVGTKARQMENTARVLDVNKVKKEIPDVKPSKTTVEDVKCALKTYTIEVNDSELRLIIWGLQAETQRNGGALSVTTILDGGIESADTDTLVAKLTAVRK